MKRKCQLPIFYLALLGTILILGALDTSIFAIAQAEDWKLPPSCSDGSPRGEECLHKNGGLDSIAQDKTQWMEVTTDSAFPLKVRYRMSRTPGDINCEEAQGTELTLDDKFTVVAGKPHQFDTRFERQQQPGNALYEWHVCFLIEGTVYRAWHGFDPGPGATLHIHCMISQEQIAAHNTDLFLCPTVEMKPGPIYSEYARHCYGADSKYFCRTFTDKASYEAWHRFNPLSDAEQDAMTLSVLKWERGGQTYLGSNADTIFLTVRGNDPSQWLVTQASGLGWTIWAGSAYDRNKGGMRVYINDFVADGTGQAKTFVGAYCGRACGGQQVLTMQKTAGAWQVSGEGPLTTH